MLACGQGMTKKKKKRQLANCFKVNEKKIYVAGFIGII